MRQIACGALAGALTVGAALAAQGQAPPQVNTRSGLQLEISGTVLMNGFYNDEAVNNADVPLYASPPDPAATLPSGGLGGTLRQSRLTLFVTAPEVLGATFSGELDLDFYGGHQPSNAGHFFALLRIRRTRMDLLWPHVSVMVGQEAPPIAELNPRSVASVGFPGMSGAGNLWLWIPQARVGVETGTAIRVGLEAAVLAPAEYAPQLNEFTTQPDLAERSGRPNFQGRARVAWGTVDRGGRVSLGGHLGWLATTGDSLLQSKGLAATVQVRPAPLFELRGEAFTGEALAVLGTGGIGQLLGVNGVPVRSTGGWTQLNVLPARWEVGAGYGWDDPDDDDLDVATARLENRMWEVHAIWRPAPLVLGFEYRRIETEYGDPVGPAKASHVNLTLGFEF